MDYKKILRDNYNIHIINTDRFKGVSLYVTFTNKFNKDDMPYLNLLGKNLVSSTKKYNTSSKVAILEEELYGSSVFSSSGIFSDLERLMISLNFLNPKYTEKIMIKKSIGFLNECLFNPNVVNSSFNENYFNINKSKVINELKSIKDNAYLYAFLNFKKNMYKDTPLGYSSYFNMDAINNVTSKDLYKFYKRLISEFKIDVFLIGLIDNEKEYIKYIDKMFINNKNKFNNKLTNEYKEFKSDKKEIISSLDFSQSQLFVGYTFKDLTEYERKYVLNFYNAILGGINNSLLFSEVRENNSLCYSIDSYVTKDPYSLVVETEIDKTNYKKVIKLIDKVFEMMKDKNKILPLYETTKVQINTYINGFYDNYNMIFEHYYRGEFIDTEDMETKREKYMNVSIDDIIKLNKKIHKSVTYFLEGDIK